MPKQSHSHKEEWARSMVGARKPAKKKAALSDTAKQAPKNATGGQEIAVSSDTGAGKGGKPITIPLSDVSPELKAILVQGKIKGGRAKVVKGKGKGKGK